MNLTYALHHKTKESLSHNLKQHHRSVVNHSQRRNPTAPIYIDAKMQSLIAKVDCLALTALADEVSLASKPGLVCPESMGSHSDMDYALFQNSIQSLTGYFSNICQLGYAQQPFQDLQQLGIACEARMMQATDQINTHKGAIFNLGFASAAVGRCFQQNIPLTTAHICTQIIENWQTDLLYNLSRNPHSHGQQMRQKYGIAGAIEQVAYGFELIREKSLPCFQAVMKHTGDHERAAMQTLMLLISQLPDTNLVWRGGMSALLIAQDMAQDFLRRGGVFHPQWRSQIKNINQYFVQHRLSPGGSADLLGVSIFFYKVENEFSHIV